MSQRLPELIEPVRMAETRRILQGTIPIANMKRLKSLLSEDSSDGEVEIDLVFSVDASGQANIAGRVKTCVRLQCQRCMQPMEWCIDEPVSLGIVRSEQQAEQLPSHYDPIIVEEETLYLSDVIEDELLLALPAVPLHDDSAECSIQDTQAAAPSQEAQGKRDETAEAEERNPFAVLEQLRNKDRG